MRVWRNSEKRKADELARLLLSLDGLARAARPWSPRRVRRVSLGVPDR